MEMGADVEEEEAEAEEEEEEEAWALVAEVDKGLTGIEAIESDCRLLFRTPSPKCVIEFRDGAPDGLAVAGVRRLSSVKCWMRRSCCSECFMTSSGLIEILRLLNERSRSVEAAYFSRLTEVFSRSTLANDSVRRGVRGVRAAAAAAADDTAAAEATPEPDEPDELPRLPEPDELPRLPELPAPPEAAAAAADAGVGEDGMAPELLDDVGPLEGTSRLRRGVRATLWSLARSSASSRSFCRSFSS